MSRLLEIAYKHLTPKQKHKALKMAIQKLLKKEKQGSKKAKAVLDKIRATKDDLVKEPTKNESRLIEVDEIDSVLNAETLLELAGKSDKQPTNQPSNFSEEAARAILKKKLGGNQLYSSVDPETMEKILAIGIKASMLYLARGAVKFSIWAENIMTHLSWMGVEPETIKPYLKKMYLAAKVDASPEIRKQMDKEDDVYDFDFAVLNKNQEQIQDNTLKWWWPQTTEDYQAVLAVQTTQPMTPERHRMLMESKLQRLVQENETPQQTMMMSVEYLPEMYQIAQDTDVKHYAAAIMWSDSMNAIMSKINWSLETTEIQEQQQEMIQESMNEQSLMSILEMM